MSWIALRVTPESNRDGVIAALFKAGSQGVQEDGDSVVTHFPSDALISDISHLIKSADPHADISIGESSDIDFSEWRGTVAPQRLGDLVVSPPWRATEFESTRTIVIEPGMAFGTGEHQTTRGVLRLMQGVIRDGDVVADLGAGSAVLSIAAIKLGAARVAAVEVDYDSIGNAEENIHLNRCGSKIEVIEGDANTLLPLLAPVRVVLANIISSVLIPMLPTIRSALAPDGQVILSGFLVDERDQILAAIEENGFVREREDTEDAWWSVQIALQ